MTQARRRTDEILDPAFASDLGGLPSEDLRRRLSDSWDIEGELSYVRRLLHGKLDILRAELERRGREDGGTGTEPMDLLTDAFKRPAGASAPSRGSRPRLPSEASQTAGRRRAERILSEAHLARLPDLDADQIGGAVERLVGAEREVSDERRRVHAVIDALTAELMQRYKSGLAPPI
jgi:hypothetical protein